MVEDPGKALRAHTVRPVNVPRPVYVKEDGQGLPAAVRLSKLHSVATIEDRWRIDDEWWRSAPLARLYYAVLLDSGQRLTLYKDLTDMRWYRQRV